MSYPTTQAILDRVIKTDSCWPWMGYTNKQGYGCLSYWSGQRVLTARAHRAVYQILVGSIPDGLVLDHLCRNTVCVNPGHLEPVTIAENNRRGVTGPLFIAKAAQTHCVHGHEYTPGNTYIRKDRGTRACRTCNRISCKAAYYAKRDRRRRG